MASRHDIINITFQANAGKANVALQTLQAEAKKSSDQVDKLKKQLADGIKANLPADQIQRIRDDIKKAEKDTKQWNKAYQELTKGVRTLDEAIKQFNAGTMGQMSAAFNKAAANAAKLAQTKMTPGTQEWKEMDALIVEAQSNVLKANTALNELTNNIKKGGTASKSTLSQAKIDLEQLLTLEVQGSNEWNNYNKQLKLVTAELNRLAAAEKKAAQADQAAAMTKRMKGLKTMSSDMLAETKRFWEAMVAGAEKGSTELTKYEAKLKQIINEEKRRKKESAETVLKTPENYGAEQIRQSVQQMTLLRDALKAGTPMWQHYNNLVLQGEAALKKYDEVEKIARGDAMSLADALKLSANAGGKGFSGTAQQLKQAEEALQKAAAAAKKGSPEWVKYQEALAKVRVEMQNAGMTSERMQSILDKPANAKNLQELSAAVKRAKMELDLMAETVGKDSKAYTQLAESTKKAEMQLKALQAQSHGTATAFDKAWSRLKTYIGLYMGAAVAIQKLTATMGDILDLSDKMGEVRKTTGFTADEVGRLSNNLTKLDVRTPLTQLMEVSAAAGQLGLKTLEDVEGFTVAANKLMIALPEMGKEAATEMMRVAIATGEVEKIRKQLQEGTIEGSSATAVAMEKIASTIDRLRATSASTAPEITDFVKRVGAVGAQSGITIDQVSALGSTISSLGLRIEMSATALSRMIPAIRNNAFDIARAIGVTPNTIRDLFDTGRGMEAILMVLQKMKDSKMDAESIEAMMGMGGMADIMKDLNQQGARAGIVFAGLSQNVDELRRQLGVASKAYEENIAVQQEFDKMNATTAARWERLKNQLEEAFVGDQSQRFLGWIIDGLRTIIDLLTGNGGLSVALKTVLAYWAAIKIGIGQAIAISLPKAFAALMAAAGTFFTTAITGFGALSAQLGIVTARTRLARMEWKKMDLALKSNYIGAIVTALGFLAYKLYDLHKAAKEAAAEVGRFNQKLSEEKKALDELFNPLKNSNTAQEERLKLINEINSKYSKYLGYMLSETSSAIQLADAHALIAKRIREEAYERRLMEQEKTVRGEHEEEMSSRYGWIVEQVREGVRGNADATVIADAIKGYIDKNLGNVDNDFWLGSLRRSNESVKKLESGMGNILERMILDGKLTRDGADGIKRVAMQYLDVAKATEVDVERHTANLRSDLRGIQGAIKYDLANNLNTLISNVASSVSNAVKQQQQQQQKNVPLMLQGTGGGQQQGGLPSLFGGGQQQGGWQAPWQEKRETTPQQQMAPDGWKPNINKKDINQVREFVQNQDALRGALQESGQQITEAQRKVAESWLLTNEELEEYRKIIAKSESGGGGGGDNGGWGNKQGAESTAYTEMNAEQLVIRRKQMKDFVNAIQTDTDVKKVLAEDAALMKAFQGRNATMREVIEWYNTERLKIQDELHARFLTNTGDWMDPKQQKNAHKQFKAELDAYLEELDAYYTERKTEIETARNNEEITEGEAWRRNLKNENEWYQRRAELLKLYAEKGAEVTEKEQDAIVKIIAERTGDSEEFVRAMIKKTIEFAKQIEASGEKGAAMVHDWQAKIDLQTQKALLKSQQAITKQVKFIEDTLAKERPYDGITKNMQDNLDKMGVLAAQMRRVNDELTKDGKEPKYSNEDVTAQSYKEMSFYLRQAEDAYRMDIDELLRRMAQEGMAATADEISKSDMLKQAVMGQLRKTYQEVHDDIKKEASQIKKDVELLWNDETLGPDGKSIKANFDKVIAQLGMQQDSVSRANSLIGAGSASDNVASRIAMKQLQVQMDMQRAQFNMFRTQANQRMAALKAEAREHERIAEKMKQEGNMAEYQREILAKTTALRAADNVRRSLGLTLAEETKKEEELQAELLKQQEEIQARLYKDLREWADLLTSSMQSVMEASNAGNAEYYNELAKLKLTGKGGPGAGTYIVIDNEGTEDARAHYEYLDERAALERQREIEQQNSVADAWRKMMDDLNQKMNDSITDWLNAMMQNASIDANTTELENLRTELGNEQVKIDGSIDAISTNTDAMKTLTGAVSGLAETISGKPSEVAYKEGGNGQTVNGGDMGVDENGVPNALKMPEVTEKKPGYGASWMQSQPEQTEGQQWFAPLAMPEESQNPFAQYAEWSTMATETINSNQDKVLKGELGTEKKMQAGAQATFAKMMSAANMYGIAYQAMSNDNLSTTQKFEMMAVQAAGQSAISMLTVDFATMTGEAAVNSASVLGKLWSQLGYWAIPVYALFTGLLGGLMGVAVSKIAKSKSEISQASGASVGAGRLSTGMLTYAEGNVNEFTDPASLTPGRAYNVDGADGKTYRAKYMGKDARTHITNGPEFHLVGEKGREAIIDAHTTRNIQMNDPEIWHTIQTLYNGGSMSRIRSRRGRGVSAFANGNIDEFAEMDNGEWIMDNDATGFGTEQMAAFQSSIDKNNELLERALTEGIHAKFDVYGKGGLVDSYDTGKKNVSRHGERY